MKNFLQLKKNQAQIVKNLDPKVVEKNCLLKSNSNISNTLLLICCFLKCWLFTLFLCYVYIKFKICEYCIVTCVI